MGNGLRPASANMFTHVHAKTQTAGGRTEWFIPVRKTQLIAGADFKTETATGNRTRKMITGPMAGKVFTDTLWQNAWQYRASAFADWQVNIGTYRLLFAARVDAVRAGTGLTASNFAKIYGSNAAEDLNLSLSAGGTRSLGTHSNLGV